VTEAPAPPRVAEEGSGALEEALTLFAVLPEAWSAGGLRALLDSGRGRLWLARDPAGAACGALALERVAEDALVHLVAVQAGLRRRGIGTALFRAALGAALAEGARRALLEVAVANGPARAFYRRLGFGVVGHRPRGAAGDALLLRCELARPARAAEGA
jgi:ribosomal protein S18 acetylase RimI-like enzyme